MNKITQNLTIQEIVPLIQEWAKERKIYEQLTPFDELLKTHEEVGELIKACYDNDKPAIQDAIGDVLVTLINLCHFVEENPAMLINKYPFKRNESEKSLHTALIINKFILELMWSVSKYECSARAEVFFKIPLIAQKLHIIAKIHNTTLEECLNIAYNEIKNRKGRIINRKFIKDKQDE
jgi:hypothetical protein